jgi:hypothetical protein
LGDTHSLQARSEFRYAPQGVTRRPRRTHGPITREYVLERPVRACKPGFRTAPTFDHNAQAPKMVIGILSREYEKYFKNIILYLFLKLD